MRSKTDRRMCGTCEFWNGVRQPIFDEHGNPKIEIHSEQGICECSLSSFEGGQRRRDLCCKCYSKWTELF